MHIELTGDVALVPKSLDSWTTICSALKQNGLPILLKLYGLELRQPNLQTLETI